MSAGSAQQQQRQQQQQQQQQQPSSPNKQTSGTKCQTCGKGFSAFSTGVNVRRQCVACKGTFCREHVEYRCEGCREGPGGEELRRETAALAAKLASVTEEKAMLEQWRQSANETQRAMVEEADGARSRAEDADADSPTRIAPMPPRNEQRRWRRPPR